ncbi:MAG: hypothetical protein ACJAYU_000023 [Bradymonadia bacterium]|jgi:hypothetical protein
MRKLFFGCSIFVFLFAVVVCVAGYLLVWKPIEAVASDWGSGVENIREVRSLDEGLDNQTAFAAPEDGLLSETQVSRYVSVQRAIVSARSEQATLRERLALLQDRGELTRDELISTFVEFSEAMRAAKVEQVAALNAQAFSAEEYHWVRRVFFAALGRNLVPMELPDLPEFGAIGDLVTNFEFDRESLSNWRNFEGFDALRSLGGEAEETDGKAVPDTNRQLVAPYRDEAQSWIPHATLGL